MEPISVYLPLAGEEGPTKDREYSGHDNKRHNGGNRSWESP